MENQTKNNERTISLLKLCQPLITGEQIYIVVPSTGMDNEYHFNEGTCPWNYLGISVMYQGDEDPHGLFECLESVPWPGDDIKGFEYNPGNRKIYIKDRETWFQLFPKLRLEKNPYGDDRSFVLNQMGFWKEKATKLIDSLSTRLQQEQAVVNEALGVLAPVPNSQASKMPKYIQLAYARDAGLLNIEVKTMLEFNLPTIAQLIEAAEYGEDKQLNHIETTIRAVEEQVDTLCNQVFSLKYNLGLSLAKYNQPQ